VRNNTQKKGRTRICVAFLDLPFLRNFLKNSLVSQNRNLWDYRQKNNPKEEALISLALSIGTTSPYVYEDKALFFPLGHITNIAQIR